MTKMTRCIAPTLIVILLTLGIGACSRVSLPSGAELPSVGSEDFSARIAGPGLVLVKFGATWCGPCVQVDQELQKLSTLAGDRAQIVKVDVDDEPGLARQYQVNSIPRLILFRDGQEIHDAVGFVNAEEMNSWLANGNPVAGEVVSNPYSE